MEGNNETKTKVEQLIINLTELFKPIRLKELTDSLNKLIETLKELISKEPKLVKYSQEVFEYIKNVKSVANAANGEAPDGSSELSFQRTILKTLYLKVGRYLINKEVWEKLLENACLKDTVDLIQNARFLTKQLLFSFNRLQTSVSLQPQKYPAFEEQYRNSLNQFEKSLKEIASSELSFQEEKDARLAFINKIDRIIEIQNFFVLLELNDVSAINVKTEILKSLFFAICQYQESTYPEIFNLEELESMLNFLGVKEGIREFQEEECVVEEKVEELRELVEDFNLINIDFRSRINRVWNEKLSREDRTLLICINFKRYESLSDLTDLISVITNGSKNRGATLKEDIYDIIIGFRTYEESDRDYNSKLEELRYIVEKVSEAVKITRENTITLEKKLIELEQDQEEDLQVSVMKQRSHFVDDFEQLIQELIGSDCVVDLKDQIPLETIIKNTITFEQRLVGDLSKSFEKCEVWKTKANPSLHEDFFKLSDDLHKFTALLNETVKRKLSDDVDIMRCVQAVFDYVQRIDRMSNVSRNEPCMVLDYERANLKILYLLINKLEEETKTVLIDKNLWEPLLVEINKASIGDDNVNKLISGIIMKSSLKVNKAVSSARYNSLVLNGLQRSMKPSDQTCQNPSKSLQDDLKAVDEMCKNLRESLQHSDSVKPLGQTYQNSGESLHSSAKALNQVYQNPSKSLQDSLKALNQVYQNPSKSLQDSLKALDEMYQSLVQK